MFLLLLLFTLTSGDKSFMRVITIEHRGCAIKMTFYYGVVGVTLIRGNDPIATERNYSYHSMRHVKLVEGNFENDRHKDESLKVLYDGYRQRSSTHENDYLYVISPHFLHLFVDFKTYRYECITLTKEVLQPILRLYWLRYHTKWEPFVNDILIEQDTK
jgi:hypothetical protein